MTPPKKPTPPSQSSTSAPPGPPPSGGPLDRARVEMGQRLRRDPLPLLYLLGFVILAGTLAYLYNHPATPEGVQQAAVRVDSLQGQVQTLTDRLAKLENRPASAASDLAPLDRRIAALEGRPAVNLAPMEGRIAAIENRPAPPPVNLQPLEARIAALEGKPPPPPFDPAPLTAQIGAVTAKETADATALGGRLDALGAKQAADTAALSGRVDSEAAKQAAAIAAATGALDARVAAGGRAGQADREPDWRRRREVRPGHADAGCAVCAAERAAAGRCPRRAAGCRTLRHPGTGRPRPTCADPSTPRRTRRNRRGSPR